MYNTNDGCFINLYDEEVERWEAWRVFRKATAHLRASQMRAAGRLDRRGRQGHQAGRLRALPRKADQGDDRTKECQYEHQGGTKETPS